MSINHRLGGSPVEILSLSRARLSGQSPCTARPLEGAGGGAERAGRRGLVYVNRSTGDGRRQGRGMFHPPPRQPLPGGRYSIDTVPRERFPSAGFRRELPEESCLRPPCTATEPGGGGCQRIPFPVTRRDRGGGRSIPLPVSPFPTGAIPHGYSVPGFGSLVAVSPDTPERSSLRPWHGYPDYRQTLARPLEGAGGGAERAGRWGWSMNTVQRLRQETGAGDVPSPYPASPSPTGAISP